MMEGAMDELKWDFHKPTKEGAYFYRPPAKERGMAIVFWKKGELRAQLTGTYMDYPLSALSGEWAGPIPEPTGVRQ
jgi:hypothetical protein